MDKYCGCNVVESVVKQERKINKPKSMRLRSFTLRLIVAVVILGVVCVGRYCSGAFANTVNEVVHIVYAYDFWGREVFGGSDFWNKVLSCVANRSLW